MNYWILKSEPSTYSFERLLSEGLTVWDGVRNYTARNNLREMKLHDVCLYYHSGESRSVVGIAKVIREAYQDPTTNDPNWVSVDISPVKKLDKPVPLEKIKSDVILNNIDLVRIGRLSVSKIGKVEYERILELAAS